MTNRLFIALIFLIFITLTSCMRDSDRCSSNERVDISIIAEVEKPHSQTKSSSKSGFGENDNIGIYWVDYENNNPMPIGTFSNFLNTEYVYDGIHWNSKNGENIYLESDNSVGDIYAYYPFDYEMSRHPDKMNLNTYPFSIDTDQSLSSTKSDFLWAKYPAVSITNTIAKLTFKHILSKIIINITYGNLGNNYESLLIHNLTPESFIDMEDGTTLEINTAVDIKPYIHQTPNQGFDKTLSAIVIPQFAYVGKSLFSVDVNNERYGYVLDETIYIEPGMVYTFNIIIGEANTRTNNKNQNRQTRISLASKSSFN